MPSAFESVFWGIVTLSIVVVLHEGGHFLAAKLFGLRVHEFMVGLPGPKVSFLWRGTRFGVTAIPLGGYVKIAGMSGDDRNLLIEPVLGLVTARGAQTTEEVDSYFEGAEDDPVIALLTLEDWGAISNDKSSDTWTSSYPPEALEAPGGIATMVAESRKGTFNTLGAAKRIAILVAGVVTNIVIAVAVFVAVLVFVGQSVDAGTIEVLEGYPAAESGVLTGDRIVAVDGRAVDGFDGLLEVMKDSPVGESVDVTVSRSGEEFTYNVGTVANPETGGSMMGLQRAFRNEPLPLPDAVKTSVGFASQTGLAVMNLLVPTRIDDTLSKSTSVIGISVAAAYAADTSAIDYAAIVASISLSLGMINILPIPPLDGGKVVLTLWEAITRRRVSTRVTTAISIAGIVALLALMAVTMFNDITRLVG